MPLRVSTRAFVAVALSLFVPCSPRRAECGDDASIPPHPDESPARPGEWGFRPRDGETVSRTPPAFSVRPQKGADAYRLEVARSADFGSGRAEWSDLRWTAFCPPVALESGEWHWRFAYRRSGAWSSWSRPRRFLILPGLDPFPRPSDEEIARRIVILDRASAPKPSTYQLLYHAPRRFEVLAGRSVLAAGRAAGARIDFLLPAELEISQSDRFDPPPFVETAPQWHLQASTRSRSSVFEAVTVITPRFQQAVAPERSAGLVREGEGWAVTFTETSGDRVRVGMPARSGGEGPTFIVEDGAERLEL